MRAAVSKALAWMRKIGFEYPTMLPDSGAWTTGQPIPEYRWYRHTDVR